MSRDADTERFEYILDDPGVEGVSHEGDRVLVFVKEKKFPSQIPDDYLISNRIESEPTDVIESGEITAHMIETDESGESGPRADRSDDGMGNVLMQLRSPRKRFRPVRPGVSEMNASAGAATAGFMARVEDPTAADIGLNADAGDVVRVSNMHVYGRAENAEIGEPIVQPSPADGDSEGAVGEYIGGNELADGSPADAAARSVRADERDSRRAYMPHGIGPVITESESVTLEQDDPVQKTGRTTGHTEGKVLANGASINVSYGDQHEKVRRRDVLVTTAMSKGGDSGAPLVTVERAGRRPSLVGHIFSGSERVSIADKLGNIEDELGVSALSGPPERRGGDDGNEGDGETPDDPDGPEDPSGERPAESEFIELVAETFEKAYGSDRVLVEPALSESDREPDLVVKTNMGIWFIEIENDAEHVLKEGVAQAMMYAGHEPESLSMVIYPDAIEVDQPEFKHLKRRSPVAFRSFPSDFEAFLLDDAARSPSERE